MKSSLVPPLTCQHGLAVGKHGTDLFKNRILLFSCLLLWSNLQYVLGLYSFLNTAGNRSDLHHREPQWLQEAIKAESKFGLLHSHNLGSMSDASVEPLAVSPRSACCSKQDRSHPGAGQVMKGPQQALPEVKWKYQHGRHCAGMGPTCMGCSACKRWIWSLFLTWG